MDNDDPITFTHRPLVAYDEGGGVVQSWVVTETTLGLALDEIRDERVPTIWHISHQNPLVTGLWTHTKGAARRLYNPVKAGFPRGVQPPDWKTWLDTTSDGPLVLQHLGFLDRNLGWLGMVLLVKDAYPDEETALWLNRTGKGRYCQSVPMAVQLRVTDAYYAKVPWRTDSTYYPILNKVAKELGVCFPSKSNRIDPVAYGYRQVGVIRDGVTLDRIFTSLCGLGLPKKDPAVP